MSGTYEDKSLSFQQIQVDSAAFRIFGFEIKSDNRVANADGDVYKRQGQGDDILLHTQEKDLIL